MSAKGSEPDGRAQARARLVERILARAAGAAPTFGAVDLQLLLGEGAALEKEGRYDQAFALVEAALEHARAQGDQWVQTFLALAAARNRMGALDEDAAAAWLGAALDRDVNGASDAVVAAAEALGIPEANARDLQSLRAMALYTTARYLAMTGRLAPAKRALLAALRVLGAGAGTDPHLSAAEVALFLAEIRIDEGDLAGFAQLSGAWAERADPGAQARWRLLHATIDQLAGRLSAAEAHLRAVIASPLVRERPALAEAARWHLVTVLGALNKVGEATAMLAELPGDAPETQQLAGLLRARASLEEAAAPEPRLLSMRKRRAPAVALAGGPARAADTPRLFERHRQECTFRAQRIRLALHRGAVEEAVGLLAWLLLWSRDSDSPLLRAEIALVRAHVTLAVDEPGAAAVHAAVARAAFASLGLPVHEREACLLEARCRPGAPGASLQRDADALLATVTAGMATTDAKLYMLNKWDRVDEEIRAWLHDVEADAGAATTRGSSRRLYKVLCQVARARGWDGPGQGADPPDSAAAAVTGAVLAERVARRATPVEVGLPLDRLGPRALTRDTALLYYVLLPDRLAVFVVTRGGCRLLWRATSRQALWEMNARLVSALRSADPGPRKPYRMEELREVDRALGQALALPELLETLPPSVRHLRIVPDDVLVHVPFAALSAGGRPLCARFSVAFVPYPRWVATRSRGAGGVRSALGVAVRDTDVPGWSSLPNAPVEVRALESLPRVTARFLDDAAAACLERVLAGLPVHDLVHFACHGEFFHDEPDASGLLLRDGWLTIRDLERTRLDRLRVAVLGSCWGADTRVLPGREMVGVAASFLRRGCRSLVTALWEFPGGVGPELATELYRLLPTHGLPEAIAALQARWSSQPRPDGDGASGGGELRPPREWAPHVVYEQGIVPGWLARLSIGMRLALRRWMRPLLRRRARRS